MPLDLLVPRLLPPADAPPEMTGVRLPALERWLAAAERSQHPASSPYAWLASEFGIAVPAPVASIALAAEGGPVEGTWMRADPVHLRIDRDAVRLHSAAVLDIERSEADALVDALQKHFGNDGLQFVAPSPERWYVRVPAGEAPATTPLSHLLGRSVHEHLPRSSGAINWRTALTEAQMLMGAHEVNVRRESARRPAINSVWFWGEGELPGKVPNRYDLVAADDTFARGLAVLSGSRSCGPSVIRDDVSKGSRVLVMVDDFARALDKSDIPAWRGGAEKLEAAWFTKMAGTLARFETVRVILPRDRDTLVATLKRPSLLDRLRTPKALAAYA
jgi:hypothetical protein